jgi:uncharacterized protein (DUF1697 family)
MTKTYCIFLRGINVNGITIKMDALREAFKQMGYADPKTILATGNVIVSVPEDNDQELELTDRIERGLSEHFNYDAHVIVRNDTEI